LLIPIFLLSRNDSAIPFPYSSSHIVLRNFVTNNYKGMAKLYFNKDIVADKDKMMHWYLTGDGGISFSDIQGFIDWIDPSDNNIDIELHSCGGRCDETYAIYDALRATGKEISTRVVGKCASAATIVLLAAPLERRSMYEHAQILIHSPYYPDGISGDMTSDKLRDYADSLEQERNRMLDLYVERTGKDRTALEAQMTVADWFEGDKALELGFVSQVIPPASAKVNKSNINSMAKEKTEKPTVAMAFRTLGIALGVVKDDPEPVSMELTTSTGDTLTVEREDGEIQVGDTASPDGTFVLEDGRTVIVKDGKITEIKEPDDTNALQEENDRLKAEIESLKANAKSESDVKILASVAKAGGEKWLKTVASTYVPAGRSTTVDVKKPEDKAEPASLIQQKLEEKRAKQKERFKTA